MTPTEIYANYSFDLEWYGLVLCWKNSNCYQISGIHRMIIEIQYFRNAVSRKYKFHGSKIPDVLVVFFNTDTHVPEGSFSNCVT